MDNLLSKYNINNINDLENYLNKFTFSKNGKDPLTIKQSLSLSLSLLKKDLRSLT
jgi:hypothetical protein